MVAGRSFNDPGSLLEIAVGGERHPVGVKVVSCGAHQQVSEMYAKRGESVRLQSIVKQSVILRNISY